MTNVEHKTEFRFSVVGVQIPGQSDGFTILAERPVFAIAKSANPSGKTC